MNRCFTYLNLVTYVLLTLVLLGQYIIRFQTINKNITEFDKIVFGRCVVNPIIQYWTCLFFTNINIFHHLKLEIALAIPDQNDDKYKQTIQLHSGWSVSSRPTESVDEVVLITSVNIYRTVLNSNLSRTCQGLVNSGQTFWTVCVNKDLRQSLRDTEYVSPQ